MSFSNDLRTTSLRERIKTLEADLKASPMRHYIYNDLPFAIFCYAPRDEWTVRREIGLLTTRLENDTDRKVITLSLADANSSMLLTSEGEPGFKYVVMPMRI